MSTTVRSFSKINLGLAIGPARPDGFHALVTLYQTLEAHDLVTVEAKAAEKSRITLTSNDSRVPVDQRNTAWKAVEVYLGAVGIDVEVAMHIDKRLPVQGGLGGGSANAVAAIIGLERELEKLGCKPIPESQRLDIATRIGSDVPLFLVGGSVLGLGHGEDVHAMRDLPVTHCVIALPEIGVSTPQAFHDWDGLHAEPLLDVEEWEGNAGLTAFRSSDKLKWLSQAYAAALGEPHSSGVFALSEDLAEKSKSSTEKGGLNDPLLALVRTGIENDFEEVVFPKYPFLGEIKRILADSADPEHSAVYASLSGSGSALFGLYGTAEAATAAVERLGNQGIRSLLTRTLPRGDYWAGMVVK